jgi:hypothetical protein
MKHLLIALCLSLLSAVTQAEPVLLGEWKSDKQKTMAFAKAQAKLEEKTYFFLEQIMGQMTVTFSRGRIKSEMPSRPIETLEGAKSNFTGFTETHDYKVLAKTQSQVAISSQEPVTGRKVITVFNFEDENTMWVYIGGASFPQLNIREYFVRVK